MKRVVISGDLTSDSTSEQYPTVTLCAACIAEDEAREENIAIVAIEGDARAEDGPCEWCGAEQD